MSAAEIKEAGDKIANMKLSELSPLPDFIQTRQVLWDKFKARYEAELEVNKANAKDIKVQAKNKDGELRDVAEIKNWLNCPLDVAKKIAPKSWIDSLVISKVDGVLWDLERPLEKDCSIEFLTFEDDQGKEVFWHSSAHIMGEAMERVFGGHLCYGPPIADGFYYDMFSTCDPESHLSHVALGHFPSIEDSMKKICNEKQPFERLELTKAELLEMFAYNQFKCRILNERIQEEKTTVYRCGTLIDLCRGPHVRNTGNVKAFKVTKTSSSYWEGKADAESLQRVYGISFPDNKQMKEWIKFQEEAAKRDHRKLGKEQGLFFFHELSPGSCFFTPKGAHIYNTLQSFIRVCLNFKRNFYVFLLILEFFLLFILVGRISKTWLQRSCQSKYLQYEIMGNFWTC